jgi:hypothetical protein
MQQCSTLSRSPHRWIGILTLALTGLSACQKSAPEPTPPAAKPAPLTQEAPAQPAPAPPPAYTTEPLPNVPYLGPGWTQLNLEDKLPICVFPNEVEREKAMLIEKVKKQTLTANSPVVFGVFGPWCLNELCDIRPTLQCWTEREADTLTVHTRFHSFHKDGTTCTKDCLEIDATCQTPALEPGTYTIRHGDNAYKLKIPSTVRAPCFMPK